jgi:hypothetical protein
MSAPFLATITLLGGGGGAQPKGGATHLAMITPLGGGHIDAGLPGAGHPDQDLPWAPARPGHDLPEHPIDPGFGGGVPVPPSVWPPLPPPPLPPDLESQWVVAVHKPGAVEWTVKSFPPREPK